MQNFFLLLCLLLPSWAMAQDHKATTRPHIQSTAGVSLSVGQAEPAWQWQWVNGLKVNNWFAGVGVGMDYYRFRTVPVFLSARRERLFNRSFFAFVDAGVAVPAVRKQEKNEWLLKDDFYMGFYSETGVGIKIPAGKKMSLLLSAGYSFRTLREEAEFPSASSYWPSPNTENVYRYKFHLLTLRAAISLGGQ